MRCEPVGTSMRNGAFMNSKTIAVITSLSTLTVRCLRSVAVPKSISSASSSLSNFAALDELQNLNTPKNRLS